jgi:integrase/recombinase XerC
MRRSVCPWFRASKDAWFVCHEGKQKNLRVKGEGNREEAFRAWHRLMGGLPTQAESSPIKSSPKPVEVKSEAFPKASVSLPELVRLFLAESAQNVKAASLRNYKTFLDPFAEAFEATTPDTLTVSQVERYFKRPKWSQSYRCGFVGTLTSLFKWAVDTGRMDRSPIRGIKKPSKQSRGRKAIISAEDHARLVINAQGDFKAFLQLLWMTGCRPGEVAGLTAQDVDLPNKCIILTQHKTAEQTGRDRLILLPDEATATLARLIDKRPTGLLFPGQNGRLSAQAIGRKMARLCVKAGVKSCMAYGYRHTFATDALASGVPDAHVAALLGHSGTTMLHKHYSHLSSKAGVLREALGRVR